jgi:hypothetical protein
MTKEIQIGDSIYEVNCSPEVASAVLNKIFKWMSHPDHYSSHSGEGIMQNDNTIIDTPNLLSDIIDDIIKPNFLKEISL